MLYASKGSPSYDGSNPTAGLTDVNGILYGTTAYAGNGGLGAPYGTVFSVTTGGAEKVLHTFTYGDGENPSYGNLRDINGTLYGTTPSGGTTGFGTVFKITTTGSEKVLYSFKSGLDGATPYASPIDVNGKLYGTTSAGGEQSVDGTAYTILP